MQSLRPFHGFSAYVRMGMSIFFYFIFIIFILYCLVALGNLFILFPREQNQPRLSLSALGSAPLSSLNTSMYKNLLNYSNYTTKGHEDLIQENPFALKIAPGNIAQSWTYFAARVSKHTFTLLSGVSKTRAGELNQDVYLTASVCTSQIIFPFFHKTHSLLIFLLLSSCPSPHFIIGWNSSKTHCPTGGTPCVCNASANWLQRPINYFV